MLNPQMLAPLFLLTPSVTRLTVTGFALTSRVVPSGWAKRWPNLTHFRANNHELWSECGVFSRCFELGLSASQTLTTIVFGHIVHPDDLLQWSAGPAPAEANMKDAAKAAAATPAASPRHS